MWVCSLAKLIFYSLFFTFVVVIIIVLLLLLVLMLFFFFLFLLTPPPSPPSVERIQHDGRISLINKIQCWNARIFILFCMTCSHWKIFLVILRFISRDYVKKHYQPWALLCSPAHTAAVIKCLQALEENSQDLLADIDPKLVSMC